MIIPNQKVKIKWNGQTKKYWEDKGYSYTKTGQYFEVDVKDIPSKSAVKVKVCCDYCGKIFEVPMYSYSASSKKGKISCAKCKGKKIKETNLEKYGAENVMQIPEFHEKMKSKMVELYGVEHPSQNKELHNRALQKYNAEIAVKNRKKTCLENYGVDNPAKLPEVIEKAKRTCELRYGGASSQCSQEIRQKSLLTMKDGNLISTSKPERQMVQKLNELYGEDNCYPQFVFDGISMDCLLIINHIKIDVEYDGKYWHDRKQEKDKRRDYYCVRRGYKVLRFRGTTIPPTIEQIKTSVDYLVDSEHHYLIIDI